jgi:hypothetical protein
MPETKIALIEKAQRSVACQIEHNHLSRNHLYFYMLFRTIALKILILRADRVTVAEADPVFNLPDILFVSITVYFAAVF